MRAGRAGRAEHHCQTVDGNGFALPTPTQASAQNELQLTNAKNIFGCVGGFDLGFAISLAGAAFATLSSQGIAPCAPACSDFSA